ncbi:hypothetical protein [uncultured Paraglaciecola sp.]|uniref:hypothetical protein n=1 Tax=uncultured Paraglaciecola sp. TaxID=1765024 RepID=UPI0030DD8F99|tara:strand:- start:17967 stop:18152 length:186 start_codon:yes stop_codon:yes gene_type:complete
MEIGSSGAGSLAQITPTQTGSVQQVNRAEQQAVLETSAPQESQPDAPSPDQRVGTVVDVSV